ncbi:MAG: hypothetical protein HKN26_05650 [Acidimicrobiales bacterium]|nr:hypothetical protein [Acidimicrobiales bacterium]
MSARRVLPSLAIIVALTAALMSPVAAGEAAVVSVPEVTESADYASEQYGDPWDFERATDHPLVPGLNYLRTSNEQISNGRLSLHAEPQAAVYLLKSWEPGGVAWGRDGDDYPIDTSRYTHLAFRMYNSTPTNIGSGVFWFDCGLLRPECRGGATFLIKPGWNTYIVPMVNNGFEKEWTGIVRGLSLVVSTIEADVEVDWIRLYKPNPTEPTVITGEANSTVYWDLDTKKANNTPSNPNWGVVGTATGGELTFPASAYPPDQYYFYTSDNGAYSAPLTINDRPRPVVLDPDKAGGADYATTIRGDAWDFSQASDVASVTHIINTSTASGVFTGSSDGTSDDSQVWLSMGAPFDSNRFHRFVADVWFGGPFSLAAAPGGGMNARLVWQLGPGVYRVTDDLVVQPGWNHIEIDLAELTTEDIEGSHPDTWNNQTIQAFRFDPTEDPGVRQFKLDNIALNEDDRGNGAFAIRFRDDAWSAGTTARIYADADNTGYDGQLIGTMAVADGVNTYHWKPTVTGTRWVYTEMTDTSGATSQAYSTGPVQVIAAAGPKGVPNGALSATVDRYFDPSMAQLLDPNRTINTPTWLMQGWALDPDTTASIDVSFQVDGVHKTEVTAAMPRGDIAASFGLGPNHGFRAIVPAPRGATICAYAHNHVAGQPPKAIGCVTADD